MEFYNIKQILYFFFFLIFFINLYPKSRWKSYWKE